MAEPLRTEKLKVAPKGAKKKLNQWAADLDWCIEWIKKLRRRSTLADGLADGRWVELEYCDEQGVTRIGEFWMRNSRSGD